MEDTHILYERSTVVDDEGQIFQTTITQTGLVRFTWLECDETGTCVDNVVFLPQDAISAAKAILRHYEVTPDA